ncbi:methanol dehydrogenase [cytochrome c] subunit [Aureimonas sp. SA4125]|uniref:methanol dehydrogenase [cytochrome c] subunit n=1 Tax=Aureimonas sp. SA4125 TaxID=2826993 RepID=UPI001CC34591|nr:methanol dehydrogenase [cytochrome c] subunit [Aureimonas sp. SA4125]
MKTTASLAALALSLATFAAMPSAIAYDGTVCKEPGNCWEPKPGYPEQVAGSEYDPQHDPMELNKQMESISGMEARNKQRVEHFAATGEFVFDVSKIGSAATPEATPASTAAE